MIFIGGNMEPEIKIGFLLSGDISPEEITNFLGVSPTQSWHKGDLVKGTTMIRKFNGWLLSFMEEVDSNELDDHIRPILSILLPKKDVIADLIDKYKLDAEISCTIYLVDETPVGYLSPEIVTGMSDLQASLDIDIILLAPN